MELYDFLEALILAPTPSGFESLGRERILELVKEYVPDFFDESLVLKSGSLLFHKAAKKKNAKKAVLDAHIDTIGFAVSEICDGGFVKVTNLGRNRSVHTAICTGKALRKKGNRRSFHVGTSAFGKCF